MPPVFYDRRLELTAIAQKRHGFSAPSEFERSLWLQTGSPTLRLDVARDVGAGQIARLSGPRVQRCDGQNGPATEMTRPSVFPRTVHLRYSFERNP